MNKHNRTIAEKSTHRCQTAAPEKVDLKLQKFVPKKVLFTLKKLEKKYDESLHSFVTFTSPASF